MLVRESLLNSEVPLSEISAIPTLISERTIAANGLVVTVRGNVMRICSEAGSGIEYRTTLQVAEPLPNEAYYPHAGGYTSVGIDETGDFTCSPLVHFREIPEGATVVQGEI